MNLFVPFESGYQDSTVRVQLQKSSENFQKKCEKEPNCRGCQLLKKDGRRRHKQGFRLFLLLSSFRFVLSCTPTAIGGELVIFSVSSQRTPPRYTCFEFGKTWTYGNPLLIRPAPISEPIAKHIPNPRSGSRLENWTRVLAFESINLGCTKDWAFSKSGCVCDKIHSLCYSSATKERPKIPYRTS